MRRPLLAAVILFSSLVVTTSASSQEAPPSRAAELLRKYFALTARPLSSVEQTFVVSQHAGDKGVVSRFATRSVFDFDNKRAIIETHDIKKGDKGERRDLARRVVILNKKGYVIDFERDQKKELSARELDGFQNAFQEAAMKFFPLSYSAIKYEPEAKYGDLVKGEQVSAPPAKLFNSGLASMRLIFNGEGHLLAVVREVIGGSSLQITVFERPVTFEKFEDFGNKSLFVFDEATGAAKLSAEVKLEEIKVNERVDDSLFRIDEEAY
jgi:hypothetical protein